MVPPCAFNILDDVISEFVPILNLDNPGCKHVCFFEAEATQGGKLLVNRTYATTFKTQELIIKLIFH
jgi:hypothetical protein